LINLLIDQQKDESISNTAYNRKTTSLDLVVAGQYSSPTTLAMLKRLGIPIVVFDQAFTLEDVAQRITQMGDVLGQPGKAAEINATYRAGLAALQDPSSDRPRAALYYANGHTSGDQGLAGPILAVAGFANVAVAAGYPKGGVMPLEVLAMAALDSVITSTPYPGGPDIHCPAVHVHMHERGYAASADASARTGGQCRTI
jgi:iron complex transport system substrate-binding protein